MYEIINIEARRTTVRTHVTVPPPEPTSRKARPQRTPWSNAQRTHEDSLLLATNITRFVKTAIARVAREQFGFCTATRAEMTPVGSVTECHVVEIVQEFIEDSPLPSDDATFSRDRVQRFIYAHFLLAAADHELTGSDKISLGPVSCGLGFRLNARDLRNVMEIMIGSSITVYVERGLHSKKFEIPTPDEATLTAWATDGENYSRVRTI